MKKQQKKKPKKNSLLRFKPLHHLQHLNDHTKREKQSSTLINVPIL